MFEAVDKAGSQILTVTDPALFKQYHITIPVLLVGDVELEAVQYEPTKLLSGEQELLRIKAFVQPKDGSSTAMGPVSSN